jgi:hypothetical protein
MITKTTVDFHEPEFTDAQFKRLDDIQEAAAKFLSTLAETDDQVWDLEDIWELIYTGADRLTKRGRRVKIPTHVTTTDGKDYITDWYGEDEHRE